MINLGDITIDLYGRDFHFMDVSVLDYRGNGEEIKLFSYNVIDVEVESVWMGETTKTTFSKGLKYDLIEFIDNDGKCQKLINNYNEL